MPLTQGHSLQGLSQCLCHLQGPVLVLFVPHLMGSLNHPHCLFTVTIPLIFVPMGRIFTKLNSRLHRTNFRSDSTHYHNVTLESLVSGFLSSHLKRELLSSFALRSCHQEEITASEPLHMKISRQIRRYLGVY